MQLLALLLVLVLGGSIATMGLMPPELVAKWAGPFGILVLFGVSVAITMRLWALVGRFRRVGQQVTRGMREPDSYGVPVEWSGPSDPDVRRSFDQLPTPCHPPQRH